jgi:5-methyltetrahydrofolate--homocysteine methyltransferase
MSTLEQISENLIKGKANEVEGLDAGEVLNNGLLAGMGVVGERFKKNEIYVPEVLIAARAMKAGSEVLKPLLAESGVKPTGTVVLGTVKGDLHDIGKNLVGMMLEGGGFQVVDLGTDVPSEKFVEAARENNAQVIGTSALLTTTMTAMKEVVDSLSSSDLGGKVKIMIGGAPVTQAYCDEIGADGYAPDAASAADLAKTFVS